MRVTVKKGDQTYVVTSQYQLDAFLADGWVEVKSKGQKAE